MWNVGESEKLIVYLWKLCINVSVMKWLNESNQYVNEIEKEI